MNSGASLVLIRGGGDLATGVAYRLHKAGFPVIVLELPHPLVVRRPVALASAVLEREVTIEDLTGRLVSDYREAREVAGSGIIPVLVAPTLPDDQSRPEGYDPVSVIVDARMAKRNIDTRMDQAPLVIALGPGFTAGQDCHAVVETMRGHRLGRVIWHGSALPNTGTPGVVGGKGAERVLRAPRAGNVIWERDIGQQVAKDELIGTVGDMPVLAPFNGVIRGLIAPNTAVRAGIKIGDVDARADPAACFTISDKALAVGGGVLEAVLTHQRGVGFKCRPYQAPGRPLLWPTLSLQAAFQLRLSKELVAFVGGGGKSSLMFALAKTLPGQVVMTTTTRIFTAQMRLAPAVVMLSQESQAVDDHQLDEHPLDAGEKYSRIGGYLHRFGSCLVVDSIVGEKATGVQPEIPGALLARPDVDYVLVEADGSRMKPCKAPADHEPVIPPGTTLVVPVAGIDALNGSLEQIAHRPERVSAIVGKNQLESLEPVDLAALITSPKGGLKGVPDGARIIPFINKVEDEEQLAAARQVAGVVLNNSRIDQVVIGAVGSTRPVREIHRRIVAAVLAAGRSERMGQTKQLMPWGSTTVLGKTLENLRATAVHDLLVVTGHEAQAVKDVATRHQAHTIYNPEYDDGELLSSLQTAVHQLAPGVAAVLAVLADQPMIEPEIIDQVLIAYWQGRGELIAPVYQGRRGNPVLIDRRFFSELLNLPQGAAPRELLRRHPKALYLVEVGSDSVLYDLDRPEDFRRWQG